MPFALHYLSQTVMSFIITCFSEFNISQSLLDTGPPNGENVHDETKASSEEEGKIVDCIMCM